MFERAQLTRIEQLHQTGRQLAVLKRMYRSYALIIERILSRQRTPLDSNSNGMGGGSDSEVESNRPGSASQGSAKENTTFLAPLTSKAVVKFERLKDRINLYALSEIQECLDEKDSLVFLVSRSRQLFFPVILRQRAEFQSDCDATIRSGGETHADHDPPGQGDDPVHAGESHDRLLLCADLGPAGGVHARDVLDLLCGDRQPITPLPDRIWGHQPHT